MGHSAMLCFLLGAITTAASAHLPMVQWGDEDIAIMAQFSTDYYNKVSREDVIYGILANDTEYLPDEDSQSHQLQFAVKETLCQKPDDEMTEDCDFKEGGVVKLCSANFFVEDNRDVVVVNCNNQHQEGKKKLAFMIKETECLKTDEDIDLEGCDYKEDGEVKLCALYRKNDEVSKNPKCVSLTKNIRINRRNRLPCRLRPGCFSAIAGL
ncbi:cathelicidin-1-like isoform X1 [Hyperolius riggenbachi]|uniref:cathelicidin-1-like isoform X1 n=1 Tax=Hyperolius riggenbachi TaxID=752182 RepID=UPI0035A2A4A2